MSHWDDAFAEEVTRVYRRQRPLAYRRLLQATCALLLTLLCVYACERVEARNDAAWQAFLEDCQQRPSMYAAHRCAHEE